MCQGIVLLLMELGCAFLTCKPWSCSQVEASMLLGHSNAELRITGAPAHKLIQPEFGRAELLVAAEV